jgi:antitoxin component YwqK of YwqJK toxin-antitoxin module
MKQILLMIAVVACGALLVLMLRGSEKSEESPLATPEPTDVVQVSSNAPPETPAPSPATTGASSKALLNELVMRDGLVYLKGDTAPYTGELKLVDPHTGKLKFLLNYKNGRRHGRFEEWFNRTQRRAVAEWQDGKITSATSWKLDGTEGSRVVNGSGTLMLFRPDGTRESEKTYRNGVQVPGALSTPAPSSSSPPVKDAAGLYVHHQSGKPFHGQFDYIKEGCRYKGRISDGQRDGLFRVWYTGGAPLMEADYSKGKINGRFVEWYPNGERMVDAIFQRGRMVRATSWKLGGKVASELPKGTGTLVLFYPNGDPRRESVYEQGVKVVRKLK